MPETGVASGVDAACEATLTIVVGLDGHKAMVTCRGTVLPIVVADARRADVGELRVFDDLLVKELVGGPSDLGCVPPIEPTVRWRSQRHALYSGTVEHIALIVSAGRALHLHCHFDVHFHPVIFMEI